MLIIIIIFKTWLVGQKNHLNSFQLFLFSTIIYDSLFKFWIVLVKQMCGVADGSVPPCGVGFWPLCCLRCAASLCRAVACRCLLRPFPQTEKSCVFLLLLLLLLLLPQLCCRLDMTAGGPSTLAKCLACILLLCTPCGGLASCPDHFPAFALCGLGKAPGQSWPVDR